MTLKHREQSAIDRLAVPDATQGGVSFWIGFGLPAGLAILALILSAIPRPAYALPFFLLERQDDWLLLIGAAILGGLRINRAKHEAPLSAGPWLPFVVALVLLIVCFVGHSWVLASLDLSRDEQMAAFDSAVFVDGHLVQKIPTLWRDHADALNTLFMYPAEHRGAWISAYLPLNAAIRALLSLIALPTLAGPLMTAVGALALWDCARRIWPRDREAPIVALLLYAMSGQVIVTGMTAYAMPAHLTCNLVWLALFLRRNAWTDAAALFVGFIAVGLHQPLMHPMFVAPLLFQQLFEKQWRRAAFYMAGYVAIGAFWLWWPVWTWSLVQASLDARPPVGVDYATRLIATVSKGDSARLTEMAANLLRFVAWQHLLLLPLIILGWKAVRRDRFAIALFGGVLVTTVTMALILPFQGHGFGYRYLHGLIGNCILLAVYGWTSLNQRDEWRAFLLRASVAGGLVLLPLQLWMAHGLYAPAAAVDARLAAIDADYLVIGAFSAPFADNFIRNPPALDERPVRLRSESLNEGAIVAICRTRPTVVLVGDRLFDTVNFYYGVAPQHMAARRNEILAVRFRTAGCSVTTVP